MVKRNHQLVEINGEKFEELINEKGLSKQGLSRELGYGDGFIRDAIKMNKLRKASTIYIETVHGIKLDDYIKKEEPKPEPEQKEPEFEAELTLNQSGIDILSDAVTRPIIDAININKITTGDIYLSVQKGVYSGMLDLLNDEKVLMSLMDLITKAHKKALRENLEERIAEQKGKMH